LVRECAEVRHDGGREPFEQRDELASNPHAQEARVDVRRVKGVGNAVPREVRVDVYPPRADERADKVAGSGRKYGESAGSCAAEEPHDHGLGSVIRVVPRSENVRVGAARGFAERFVSGFARSSLKVASLGDADARAAYGDAKGPGEVFGEVELSRGFGAQSVVDSVRDEIVAQTVAQSSQYMEERHRVAAAADGHEHPLALAKEPRVLDRPCREGEE
jgi:hypothetical protein